MRTKFTSKCWGIEPTKALNENENSLYYDIVSDGQLLASTHKNIYIEGLDDEQQFANAKLIAAAPEMFEMLKDILLYLESENQAEAEEMLSHQIKQLLTKITQ